MDLGEIFKDALVYPFHNIKALVLYAILGIILGISIIGTLLGITAGIAADNIFTVLGSGIIGIIVAIIVSFAISGYELDIINFGVMRNSDAPGIDFVRQFTNGVKFFIVSIVYMIIPIIIFAILAVIFQHWLASAIDFIVAILFSLMLFMAQCRLAKTDDLTHALAVGDAFGDIFRIGFIKILLFAIIVAVIAFILMFIAMVVAQWTPVIGGIILGILGVYLSFFSGRATGLLYSDI